MKVCNIFNDDYDEFFAYDARGRITMQCRGVNTNSSLTSGSEYTYKNGTNKQISVASGMSGTSASSRIMSAPNNFVYDSESYLTEDKYLQGESGKNALVHFYCRTVVYCACTDLFFMNDCFGFQDSTTPDSSKRLPRRPFSVY